MTERVLLIPAAVVGAQVAYMWLFKSHKTKKDARSELMMRAFIGLILGIVAYGVISRLG